MAMTMSNFMTHAGVLLACVSWFCFTPSALADEAPSSEAFFEQSFGDLSEELSIARDEGKKGVLVFFELTECPFCHRLRETVLSKAHVQRWYKQHYRCVTLDIEGDTEVTDFAGGVTTAKEFARLAKVKATPVIAFYGLDGEQVVRYTGAPRTADEFLLLGEFAAGGHYATTNFTRFKRAQRAGSSAAQ